MTVTDTDLAYAAGIIDGEGSLCISEKKDGRVFIQIQVSQALPSKIPMWLYDNFGGRYGEYDQKKSILVTTPDAKRQGRWAIYGKEARLFALAIRTFLLEKTEQADLFISFPIAERGQRAEREIQQYAHKRCCELNR